MQGSNLQPLDSSPLWDRSQTPYHWANGPCRFVDRILVNNKLNIRTHQSASSDSMRTVVMGLKHGCLCKSH
jgi:hypothetical protein